MSIMDFNDAEEQRQGGVIPDGTFVKSALHIRPGGASLAGMDGADLNIFKASTSSDAILLDCEFTVISGQYAHRKWWENMTVAGGSLDDKGVSKGWNMTKSRIRAMLESALSIDPKDMSERAKMQRQIPNFKYLDGMPFFCKVTVEPGGDKPGGGKYADKNVIDRIIIPGDAEYADIVAGKDIAPMPRNTSVRASAAPVAPASSAATPVWSRATTPTPAPTAAPNSTNTAQAPQTGAATIASPSNAPVVAAGPAWLRS